MERTPITAIIVEKIDCLLAQGAGQAVITAKLRITEYVVGVIAGDKLRDGRPQPAQLYPCTAARPTRGVDAATIRMIQRMLEVNIMRTGEIARQAGVSSHVVESVMRGDRVAVSTERPRIFKDLDERFLREPIRCSGCHAMIEIVPCRACRAKREGRRKFPFR